MEKVMYLCDGEKPDCEKIHCYKNMSDGLCRHTSDITHAVNFKKKVYEEHIRYWETSHNAECGMRGAKN